MDEVTSSHNPVLYWLYPHLDQNGPPITGFKNRGPAHPLDPCSTPIRWIQMIFPNMDLTLLVVVVAPLILGHM